MRRATDNSTDAPTAARTRSAQYALAMLLPILLVALFFRVYRLAEIPAGVDYDEAGNLILAREIAAGASRPIFIRAYAGREALFYWLAAGVMRLLGPSLWSLRLAAALCGVGTVLYAYLLARELFQDEAGGDLAPEAMWVPLLTAALIAVSTWHVHVSRYGFRANAMTLLLAATMTYLWRGLRRNHGPTLVLAGLLCGLSANTYLAVRAFPLVLLVFAAWVIATWSLQSKETHNAPSTQMWGVRRPSSVVRLQQFAVFGLAALVALAPLAWFFVQNPQYFSTRMSQTSIFDPEIHGGDLWGTLGRVTLQALGVFTVRGDSNPVYNYAETPIFGPVSGACFYVGLLLSGWRLFRRPAFRRAQGRARTPYLLLLVWLPVMLVPNVLGARGVPHSLRSMGLIPAVYIVAALGVHVVVRAVWNEIVQAFVRPSARQPKAPSPTLPRDLDGGGRRDARPPSVPPVKPTGGKNAAPPVPHTGEKEPAHRKSARVFSLPRQAHGGGLERGLLLALTILLLLTVGGRQTYYRYFVLWPQDAAAYYRSATGVRRAAEYLNAWDPDEVTIYVSNDTYRHTTIAAFAEHYDRLKWISGQTLVLPSAGETPALYVFDHTNPLDPVLARYLPPAMRTHRELGPDGGVSFEAYLWPGPPGGPTLPGEPAPTYPLPRQPAAGNLGGALSFLGHDLNRAARSGETLDVTLYWRVEQRVDRDDWTFFAHLVDARGFRWGGETFFHYPSGQWAPGEVLLFRQQIAIDPGAPPGAYTLDLGVFSPSLDARLPALDANGQLAGTTLHAGPFDIVRAAAPPEELPAMQQRLDAPFGAPFGDAPLTLLGSDRDRSDLRPGETLALTLHWQLQAALDKPYEVSIRLENKGVAGGPPVPLWQGDPVQGSYPFDRWQPPEYVRDRYALRLPLETAPGEYELVVALPELAQAPISLGAIHVHASDRLWEPPPVQHEVGARLGTAVELVGYTLRLPEGRETARPGDTLHLTLVWRCLEQMETGYTVFTHLLDEAGQIRGQQDNPPVGGRYPTPLWAPGEIVVDEYALRVQPDSPAGPAVIEVGLYDPATLARLPVLNPTGATGDRVLLGDIQIEE